MRDGHNRIAGLAAVVLLCALAIGAEDPKRRVDDPAVQKPAHNTAVFVAMEPRPGPTESDDPNLPNGSETQPAKTSAECAGLVVRATELVFSDTFETGDTSFWGPEALARFSASRMLDLKFTVELTNELAGDHLIRLKLLTPKGHHYQTLSVPITSTAKRQGSVRRVEGYPRPLAVQTVQKAGSSSLPGVTLSVPVGGTPIVTSSIFGVWMAQAFLDASNEVCASRSFVLTP